MKVRGAEITEAVMEEEAMTIVVLEEMTEIVDSTGVAAEVVEVAAEVVEAVVYAMLGKKVIAQEAPHAGFLMARKEAGIVAADLVPTAVNATITKRGHADTEILADFHMKVVVVIEEEMEIMVGEEMIVIEEEVVIMVGGEMIMDETKVEVMVMTKEVMGMEEHHVPKTDFGRMVCFTKEAPVALLAPGLVLALTNVPDLVLIHEVEGHLFLKDSVGHVRVEKKIKSSAKFQLSQKRILRD